MSTSDLETIATLFDQASRLAGKVYKEADADFDFELAYQAGMWADYLRMFQREANVAKNNAGKVDSQ